MPRRTRLLAPLLAVAAVVIGVGLAACQDYNFSPVRYGIIQPGTARVTLSDISTADILFVVDDSGSMGGEQQKLAASFQAFVSSLKTNNVARVNSRLEPIDFHIAVTTTSVFLNSQLRATCSTSCGGAAGQQVCCDTDTSQPVPVPRGCATAADCSPGRVCSEACQGRSGEKTCCTGTGATPETVALTCSQVGAACGRLLARYQVPRTSRACGVPIAGGGGATTSCALGPNVDAPNPAPAGYSCRLDCSGLGTISACCADAAPHVAWLDPTCDLGVGTEGGLYPRGDFVRKGSNPRVLHFDKSLFCTRTGDGTACVCAGAGAPATCDPPVVDDAAIDALILQFQQNVAVGTCGSGQEQGLEAARRAIQKAIGLGGQAQPAEAGGAPPEWPHPRRVVAAGEKATSKLVVVFVGDEDDCSSPEDVTRGIIFANSGGDACELDGTLAADQQRRFKLQEYADFLTSLGRPVAGAFIVSAVSETCVDSACGAGTCCDTQCTGNANVCTLAGLCGGQGAGFRFVALEKVLREQKRTDTVLGSVCNPGTAPKPGFSSILERVAEVVKQPVGLELPTQPAAARLTLLRIAGPDGKTRKTCRGPALPPLTVAEAEAAAFDWWFTGGDDTNRTPTGASRFVFLNLATHACEANPGETYSADYIGLMPIEGCLIDAECQLALGGASQDWLCDTSEGGVRGTCLRTSLP